MAKNYLQPFANASDANVMTEADWASPEMQLVVSKGFQSGIARSMQVNRAVAQGTSAGYAIGQLIVDYAKQDANIQATTLYAGFKKALESFAKKAVIGFIYPVGSIYISTSATNPATLFGIGTWVRIGEGRGLVDCGNTIKALSTGGTASVTLTANELPSHNHKVTAATAGGHNHTAAASTVAAHSHSVTASGVADHTHNGSSSSAGSHAHSTTVGSAGKHTHSVVVSSSGGHTHTRGTMNISGQIGRFNLYTSQNAASGAFYCINDEGFVGIKHGSWDSAQRIYMDAARNWTGATSSNGDHSHSISLGTEVDHKHSVTIGSVGSHSHTITVAKAGKHTHTMSVSSAGGHTHTLTVGSVAGHTHTMSVSNEGGGKAFNVRNPYLAVYIWRRTA